MEARRSCGPRGGGAGDSGRSASIRRVIEELARADEDVRVRRGGHRARRGRRACSRDLARSERDEDLRREVAERLVAIATAPAATDADAALALDGLDGSEAVVDHREDRRRTTRSARRRSAACTTSRRSAASRAMPPIRRRPLDAVARVADAAELLNIALKTDHKDAGIAALEKSRRTAGGADDRATLESAERAREEQVRREARPRDGAGDRRGGGGAGALALEQWQQRVGGRPGARRGDCRRPVGARRGRSARRRRGRLARASRRAGTFELDPDTAGRFGALVEAARAPRSPRTSVNRRSGAPPPSATRRCRPRGSRCASGSRMPAPRTRSTRSKRRAPNGKGCRDRRGQEIEDEPPEGAVRRGLPARDRAAPEPPGDRAHQRAARRAVARRPSGSRSQEHQTPPTRGTAVQREWALAAREIRRARSGDRRAIRRGRTRACGCAPRSAARPPSARCGSRCSASSS